eukprot:2375790-Prymnesium_polylepis.1
MVPPPTCAKRQPVGGGEAPHRPPDRPIATTGCEPCDDDGDEALMDNGQLEYGEGYNAATSDDSGIQRSCACALWPLPLAF